jgi:hypothetical protein
MLVNLQLDYPCPKLATSNIRPRTLARTASQQQDSMDLDPFQLSVMVLFLRPRCPWLLQRFLLIPPWPCLSHRQRRIALSTPRPRVSTPSVVVSLLKADVHPQSGSRRTITNPRIRHQRRYISREHEKSYRHRTGQPLPMARTLPSSQRTAPPNFRTRIQSMLPRSRTTCGGITCYL